LAFLRFTRDRRGVENFYLVQPTTNRRGKVRPRVLYWFRSPPDVKVGRQPFDPAVRQALEAQNPDVAFDWRAIVETPIPSADADKWRERRRADRAAKHAAAEEESAEALTTDGDARETPDAGETPPTVIEHAAAVAASGAVVPVNAASPEPIASPGGATNRKRRRRRRGGDSGGNRGGPPAGGGGPAPPPPVTEPSGD
jgi:hypothetical protein